MKVQTHANEDTRERFEGGTHESFAQGYHEETIFHQREDDEPLDYKTADASIGDIQHFLLHTGNHLVSEAYGRMFRELAVLRAKLKRERNQRFPKKERTR